MPSRIHVVPLCKGKRGKLTRHIVFLIFEKKKKTRKKTFVKIDSVTNNVFFSLRKKLTL